MAPIIAFKMADKMPAEVSKSCTNLLIYGERSASEVYHINLVKITIADIFRDTKTINLSFKPIWCQQSLSNWPPMAAEV